MRARPTIFFSTVLAVLFLAVRVAAQNTFLVSSSGTATAITTTVTTTSVTISQQPVPGSTTLVPFYVIDLTGTNQAAQLVAAGSSYTFSRGGGFPANMTIGKFYPAGAGSITLAVVQTNTAQPSTRACPTGTVVNGINVDGTLSCVAVATAAPVNSVFGRQGDILPQAGDYTVAQVTSAESVDNKDQANGYAGLDSGSKISHSTLPALLSGDIPNNAADTSGAAGSLVGTPTKCSAGSYPLGIDSQGNAQNCTVAVPTTRTVNGYPLSANVSLLPTDLNFGGSVVWAQVLPGGNETINGGCTVTSGSPNFSCTGTLWDTSMNGFLIRANTTNQGNAFALGTTVTITDATHGVASANASYSSSSANIGLFPRDETSTLNTAIAAAYAQGNCGAVMVPRGTYLLLSAPSNIASIPGACQAFTNGSGPFFHMQGFPETMQGKGTSFVLPVDFDWSTCVSGTGSNNCFSGMQMAGLNINCMNYQSLPAGAQNKTVMGSNGRNFGVHHCGTVGVTGFRAYKLLGNGGFCEDCFFDSTGIVDWNTFFGTFSGYIEGGTYLQLGSSATLQIGSQGTEIDGILFTAGSANVYCSQGARLGGNTNIGGTSVAVKSTTTGVNLFIDGCSMNGSSTGNVFYASNGNSLNVHATHMLVSGTFTQFLDNNIQFFDECGNTLNVGGMSLFAGTVYGDCSVRGTADTAAKHVLTSGWGTANVNTVTGQTTAVTFTISVTGGVPAASPVLTDTFATAFLATPSGGCSLTEIGGTFGVLTNPVPSSLSATGVVWTFSGTPVSGQSYTFQRICRNP